MCYTKRFITGGPFGGPEETVQAEFEVPADSKWFDGHFPEEPILPGIAQLSMIADLLGDAIGSPATITQVSRVRFKRVIQPAEPITVRISSKEDALSFGFQILSGAEPVCSGNIRISR